MSTMRGERSRFDLGRTGWRERICANARSCTSIAFARARIIGSDKTRTRRSSMNRNWDIMRNAANGADPYGATRRMEQNRMRDRERFTSRDRQEGFGGARWFDGVPDYG